MIQNGTDILLNEIISMGCNWTFFNAALGLLQWRYISIIASQITGDSNVCSIVKANITENSKGHIAGLLWGESTGVFPSQRARDTVNMSTSSWSVMPIQIFISSFTSCPHWIWPRCRRLWQPYRRYVSMLYQVWTILSGRNIFKKPLKVWCFFTWRSRAMIIACNYVICRK